MKIYPPILLLKMATKLEIYRYLSGSNYFYDFISIFILIELYLQSK